MEALAADETLDGLQECLMSTGRSADLPRKPHKAAQLATLLDTLAGSEGIAIIEEQAEGSLHYEVFGDVMCIMHSDGSVNIIEHMGQGVMKVEVIAAGNILKVLNAYRPFSEVFRDQLQ